MERETEQLSGGHNGGSFGRPYERNNWIHMQVYTGQRPRWHKPRAGPTAAQAPSLHVQDLLRMADRPISLLDIEGLNLHMLAMGDLG